jgi:hypothetical protein
MSTDDFFRKKHILSIACQSRHVHHDIFRSLLIQLFYNDKGLSARLYRK